MNTPHTAGPWQWNENAADIWPTSGRRAPIATVFTAENPADELSDESASFSVEEAANARLIAAAPTMYLFLASKADCGDDEAMQIIQQINNEGNHVS